MSAGKKIKIQRRKHRKGQQQEPYQCPGHGKGETGEESPKASQGEPTQEAASANHPCYSSSNSSGNKIKVNNRNMSTGYVHGRWQGGAPYLLHVETEF